jgi:hypothetical protein
MRRLVVFLAVAAALLAAVAAFDWRVDPYGEVWKPGATADARADGCLVSEELIGSRYLAFKLDVFHHRPTRTIVVGSSRMLKLRSHPGERSFSNLGYPGTAPETILHLFHVLPATPRQTVYLGVEAFWFNPGFSVPDTDPSAYRIGEYLLSRSTFRTAFHLAHQAHFVATERWHRSQLGPACVIDRLSPAIEWRADGSRVWAWELDAKRFPPFTRSPFDGDLATWRNGFYGDWHRFDTGRLQVLDRALALARRRGWKVVGFAPPEPPDELHVIETDPRIAPQWTAFLRAMPSLFRRHGFRWAGIPVACPERDFPDAFHSGAVCSDRLRERLDKIARRSR